MHANDDLTIFVQMSLRDEAIFLPSRFGKIANIINGAANQATLSVIHLSASGAMTGDGRGNGDCALKHESSYRQCISACIPLAIDAHFGDDRQIRGEIVA